MKWPPKIGLLVNELQLFKKVKELGMPLAK
jgi:hypothetical protein